MTRLLPCISRPFGVCRTVPLYRPISLAHQVTKATISSNAMAHPSATNSQTTWHGAGAAEFDLRSIFGLNE